MVRQGRIEDGRRTNRAGKTGSHLLRGLLRELPAAPERRAAPSHHDVSLPSDRLSDRSTFSQLCPPLMASGTALQKQLMVSACKYFQSRMDTKGSGDSSGDPGGMAATCDRILFTPSRPQSSFASEADALKASVQTFRRDLICTASAVWQAGTAAWDMNFQKIRQMICSGSYRGIALLKSRVYDETPVKLRVETGGSQPRQLGSKAETCIAKVMQTRFKVGYVLQNTRTNGLVYCCGIAPTVLQALERTRGSDICMSQSAVIASVPEMDRASPLFRMSIDISVADRYMANARAEAGLQALRPKDVPLHIDCEVHKASTSTNWMLGVSEQHISGLLSASLVLRQAGALASFRAHLLEEIKSRLMVVHGRPPEGPVKEYRLQVYDRFLGTDLSRQEDVSRMQVRRATQRAILDRFVCGDLQADEFQLFTGGFDASDEQIIKLIQGYILPALVPGGVPPFARHRWLGGEAAVDWIGLVEAHNSLFSRTICRMYGVQRHRTPPALSSWAALEAEAIGPEEDELNPAVEAVLAEDQSPEAEAPTSKSETDWAEFNKSMQKKLQAWVGRHDLGILSLIRAGFLKRSSTQWADDQDAAAAAGEPPKHRMGDCYVGADIDEAFDEIHTAFRKLPAAVPAKSMTRSHRVVMFVLLSRLGGALHFFLRGLRSGCPFQLAELLADDADEFSAKQVLGVKECMQDSFTKALLKEFPTPAELLSNEARAIVHAAFHLAEVDVASIECRHAAVRHIQDTRSLTWNVILQTLSAVFLCRQTTVQNTRYQDLTSGVPLPCNVSKHDRQKPAVTSRRKKQTPPAQRKGSGKRGGGGAQRAYFHRQLKRFSYQEKKELGRSYIYSMLHREYRALSDEEKSHYTQLGRAAVLSNRAGNKSFASRTRLRQRRMSYRDKPAAVLLDMPEQADAIRFQTRKAVVALARAESAATVAKNAQTWQQRIAASLQQPCEARAPVPCAHMSSSLQKAHSSAYEWCAPGADLAKAALVQNQRDWERNRQAIAMKTVLSDMWDKQHQLQHAAPPDTTKPSPQSLCLKYGMCLCSGRGAHARMMHAKLASIMRPRLISRSTKSAAKQVGAKPKKVKTPARVLMDSSMICLQLSAVEPPLLQFDATGWPRLDDAEDAPPPDCWLHLNYINLKDMEFTCLQLNKDDAKQKYADKIVLSLPDRVTSIRKSCEFLVLLDLRWSWDATWYEIISDGQVLSEEDFIPNQVEVRKLADDILPNGRIWQGLDTELLQKPRRPQQSRKRRKPQGGRQEGPKRTHRALPAKAAPNAETSEPILRDTASDAGFDSDEEPEDQEDQEDHPLTDDDAAGPACSNWEKLADISEKVPDAEEEPAHAEAASGSRSVPPPPPNAEAKAPPRKPASRAKTVIEESYPVHQGKKYIGCLNFNARTNTLTAHCGNATHGDCRKQRTLKPGNKAGQGRPIGYLVSWLLQGSEFESSWDHVHGGLVATRRKRIDARALFMEQPGSEACAKHERPRTADEPEEPDDFS